MIFFTVGICFICYLNFFLLNFEKKKGNVNKHFATLLYKWMLIDYVEEKYFIKTSKLFLVSNDFRWLTIDSTMLAIDLIFLYPSFFVNTLFLILILIIMVLFAFFKMTNDFVYFKNNTQKIYFLKFKLILLKIYFFFFFYTFFVHVFLNFAEDINIIQELLIKFIFLYCYYYY